jgi:glucosylceramidase
MKEKLLLCLILAGLSGLVVCQTAAGPEIEAWITKPDRSMLFEKSTEKIPFSDRNRGRGLPIVIDESHSMQTIDGFGFALTGGSAELMIKMTASARKSLITDLFANTDKHIGVSYIGLQ